MRTLNRIDQRSLRAILNHLIDCQHDRLAGMRLNLIALKRAPVPIYFQKYLACFAANLFVVKALDAAQANFIRADKTQYMRGQRIVRVVALWLTPRINAFQLKLVEFGRSFHFDAPNDPDKFLIGRLSVVQPSRQLETILTCNRGKPRRGHIDVLDFTGIGEERFGVQTTGQLTTLTIENLPASSCRFNRT